MEAMEQGVDGVGNIVPANPLRPVGGTQDGSGSPREREPRRPPPRPPGAPQPQSPPRPPDGEPGHRIDELA